MLEAAGIAHAVTEAVIIPVEIEPGVNIKLDPVSARKLTDDNRAMRAALEFYADPSNWERCYPTSEAKTRFTGAEDDGFEPAQAALAQLEFHAGK